MRNYKLILRFIGIIIILLLFICTDLGKFIGLIEKINLKYFLLSAILFPIFIFFKIIRWRSLLFIQHVSYPMMSAFVAYFTSIFLGVITPGRVGEFSRALYLKDDIGVPMTKGISSIIMDRLLDLCVLVLSASVSIYFLPNKIKDSLIIPLLAIIFTIIFFFILIIFCKNSFKRLLKILQKIVLLKFSIDWLYSTSRKLRYYIIGLLSIRLVLPLFLTTLNVFLFFIITILIGKAVNIPNQHLLIIIPSIVVANIVGLIPITISGVGTRDAIFVAVFDFIGMNNPLEHAILFSLGFLLIFTGLSVLLGSVAWFIKPIKIDGLGKSQKVQDVEQCSYN